MLPGDPAGLKGVARDASQKRTKTVLPENDRGVPQEPLDPQRNAGAWAAEHSIDGQVSDEPTRSTGHAHVLTQPQPLSYLQLHPDGNASADANPIRLVTVAVINEGDKVMGDARGEHSTVDAYLGSGESTG